jgi:hypothetical protein
MPSLNTKLASAPNTTANYVLKATTSTTIGNSLIFDNGTNVGIGNTNTTFTFDVTGTGRFTGSLGIGGAVDTYQQMTITASTAYTVLGLYNTSAGSSQRNWSLSTNDITAGDFAIRQSGSAGSNPFAGGSLARLYINPSGNVGIGTSSPSRLLTVVSASDGITAGISGATYGIRFDNGGTFSSGMSTIHGVDSTLTGSYQPIMINGSDVRFGTGATERMRILSSGFVGIGTTNPTRPLMVESSNSGTTRIHNTRNLSGSTIATWELGGTETNATSSYYLYCDTDSVGVRMVIYGNGNLANVNNSYGAYSDIKLKENIIDATPKLEDLLKVKVRNYNLKGDDKKQIGVIAQELEDIFPGLIEESNDTIKNENGENIETGEKTKSVKYSVFVPMLIKAIQEQQKQIDELKQLVK